MPQCVLCDQKQFVISTGGNCLKCARLLGQQNTLDFNKGILKIEQAKKIIEQALKNQDAFKKENGF